MVERHVLLLVLSLFYPFCSAWFVHDGYGWSQNRIQQLSLSKKHQHHHRPLQPGRRHQRTTLQLSSSTSTTSSTLAATSSSSLDVAELYSRTDSTSSTTKLSRLKDLMWCREAQEDVTAAEFACSVEAARKGGNVLRIRQQQRAVDYEKLLAQLNARVMDLQLQTITSKPTRSKREEKDALKEQSSETGEDDDENSFKKKTLQLLGVGKKKRKGDALEAGDGTSVADLLMEIDANEDFSQYLDPNRGMGRLTYTPEQRTAFLERIVRTRYQLVQVMMQGQKSAESTTTTSSSKNNTKFLKFPTLPKEEIAEASGGGGGPKLYVRDDGTVDWDGALQDQAALREFGTAVWARINGREATLDDEQDKATPTLPTAKIPETPAIQQSREQLETLSVELVKMEQSHIRLLNSAISQGQATANIKLASLAPQLRSQIQESAAALDLLKLNVSFQTLVYEMERIFTYLLGEVGNARNGYIPLQDRLNVAEFGLLESQMDSFRTQFRNNEPVDEDVLAVVYEQLTDFKRRLGIDYYVTGLSLDREAIARWLQELLIKTKKGLAFYVKGVQLFWNDIVFCLRLVNRAAQGYTLKPREVRTIRRTFKDIVTFIPFMIILLIPLTPIGHVLVFGAIQRFFPDFFPSCFTEQRQNLLQLYETAEYSELTIKETWGKKLSRLITATIYLLANTLRRAYFRIIGSTSKSNDDDEERKL